MRRELFCKPISQENSNAFLLLLRGRLLLLCPFVSLLSTDGLLLLLILSVRVRDAMRGRLQRIDWKPSRRQAEERTGEDRTGTGRINLGKQVQKWRQKRSPSSSNGLVLCFYSIWPFHRVSSSLHRGGGQNRDRTGQDMPFNLHVSLLLCSISPVGAVIVVCCWSTTGQCNSEIIQIELCCVGTLKGSHHNKKICKLTRELLKSGENRPRKGVL